MAEINRARIPGENEEEINKNLIRYFREVFSTDKGRAVLNVILTDLHYFDVCTDDEDRALSNYAKMLISSRLGMVDTVAITDSLFSGIVKEE